MYDGPPRPGNRGGAGDFRWSAIVDDKHRENYLGATVNAPQGRWQKNKDIHWYSRDVEHADADEEAARKREELRRLKEAEEEALSVALGFAPSKKLAGDGDAPGTGANGIAVASRTQKDEEIERQEKEERRKDKELRKELRMLKRAERELRREEKERNRGEKRSKRRSGDDYVDDGRSDDSGYDSRDRHRHGHRSHRRRHDSDPEDDDRHRRHRDSDRYRDDDRRRDKDSGRYRSRSRSRERDRDRDRSPDSRRRRDDDRRRSDSRDRRRRDSPARERHDARRSSHSQDEVAKRYRSARDGSRTPPVQGQGRLRSPTPERGGRVAGGPVNGSPPREPKYRVVDEDA